MGEPAPASERRRHDDETPAAVETPAAGPREGAPPEAAPPDTLPPDGLPAETLPAETGRRRARRLACLVGAGVLGALGATLVVVTGGRLALGPVVTPPTAWFGLLDPVADNQPSLLPAVLILGAALLVAAWWWVCRCCQRGELSMRTVVVLIACWSAAPLVGPPILSLDVYSYVAQGAMVSAGFDPYTAGPALLGNTPAALAADPIWANTPSPYGPVGLGLFHAVAAVTGGRVVGAIILLRVVVAVAVAALAWCVTRAVPTARRPFALAAGVGGPVVLLELLGAVHLEAVMMALAAAGLLAVLRGRVGLGQALLTAAALTKWPAAVILLVLVLRRWADLAADREPGRARRLAAAAGRDVTVVGVTAAVLSLLVPDGLGWLRATSTPSLGLSLYSPVSALANLIAIVDGEPGAALPGSAPLRLARTVGMVAAALVIGWLLLTVRRRDPLSTCGLALLTLALLGPVLYPWYLVWGTVPLAMAAGPRRRLLTAVGGLGALLSVPHPELLFVGRPWLTQWFSREGPIVLVALTVCVGMAVLARRRLTRSPSARRSRPA